MGAFVVAAKGSLRLFIIGVALAFSAIAATSLRPVDIQTS